MIRPIQSLVDIADKYSDTQELADALRIMADDDAIGPTSIYYLKECASHMEALYSDYLETVRALKTISIQERN